MHCPVCFRRCTYMSGPIPRWYCAACKALISDEGHVDYTFPD